MVIYAQWIKWDESTASHIYRPSLACAISLSNGWRNNLISLGEFGPGVARFIMTSPEVYQISGVKFSTIKIRSQVLDCFFIVN
jgi:hypothetical protein